MTITAAPLTTAVMGSVDQRHAGTASCVNNAVARIAGTLAVALLGTVAVSLFGSALATRLDGLRVSPGIRATLLAQTPLLVEVQVPPVDEPTRHLLQQAIADAFVHTFRSVVLVCAALALASALCAALTPAAPKSSETSLRGAA